MCGVLVLVLAPLSVEAVVVLVKGSQVGVLKSKKCSGVGGSGGGTGSHVGAEVGAFVGEAVGEAVGAMVGAVVSDIGYIDAIS